MAGPKSACATSCSGREMYVCGGPWYARTPVEVRRARLLPRSSAHEHMPSPTTTRRSRIWIVGEIIRLSEGRSGSAGSRRSSTRTQRRFAIGSRIGRDAIACVPPEA